MYTSQWRRQLSATGQPSLFVIRKMTALGLNALYESAPCLEAWRAATLGYGGSLASSCLASKVGVFAMCEQKAIFWKGLLGFVMFCTFLDMICLCACLSVA